MTVQPVAALELSDRVDWLFADSLSAADATSLPESANTVARTPTRRGTTRSRSP
jgi:hypothetical protein